MKKLFFLLSLLISLTLGIGQMWGAADVTYDFTGSGWTVSSGTLSNGTVSFTGSGTNFKMNSGYFYMGKSGAYINFPTYASAVEKIVVTGNSGASGSVVQNIFVGDNAVSTATTGATGTNTYNIASGYQAAGTTYTLKVTSNHNTQVTKIEVFFVSATPTCATPTFDPEGGEFSSNSIDVEIATTTDGATIYYTTDGTNPTTSSSVYSSALNLTETTTVKAIAVKEGASNSAVASATYTKVAPFAGSVLEITKTDFTTVSYDDNAGDHEKDGVTFTTAKVYQSGSSIQFQKTNGLLYNKTDLGEIAKIEITTYTGKANNLVVYAGTSENPSSTTVTGSASGSVTTYKFASGNGFFAIKCNSTGASNVDPIKIYYTPASPAAVAQPTISGDENFTTSTTVTLGCTTDGASIYYTTDGSTPTSSSTAYSAPFTLNATATVKAIAINGGASSEVATKSFTKVTPLTTMDAIYSKASENSGAEKDVFITFNNWIVSGVASNGKNVYLTDGTKGLIIFDNSGNTGFVVGNILSGTAACKVQLYNGSAELTNLTSSATGLTVTTGGTATLNELDAAGIEALSGINTGSLIKVSGECSLQTINSKDYYYIAGVQLYTTLFTYTNPTAGNNYNCTGVYVQYNSTKEMLPRSAADIEEIVEEGAPETPTFSPAAGTYTSVQNVEISCATQGATIYYTTDNSTPTSESTVYTEAISVSETMTIKAIAIKNELTSATASATYTINLPEDEETSKTWDLTKASYNNDASADKVTWSAAYVTMTIDKDQSSNAANNYLGGDANSRTSTRFYSKQKLTITPNGKKLTTIVFEAASAAYATVLINSTWTNATAALYDAQTTTLVKVTPQKGGAVSAIIGATCGFKQVRVEYQDVPNIAVTGVSLDQTDATLKEGKSLELTATITPEDAGNLNVTWSSSDENIATVDGGTVTAVAIGTATITATTVDGDYTATCRVTVIDPSTRFEPFAAFQKVTATGDITDGDYLIVYEEDGAYFAFDGGLETLDAAHNNIEVTIEEGYIKAPGDAIFTIDVTNGKIRSYSGAYIGVTSNSNGLKQSSSADTYTNSFSISEGNVVISAAFEGSTMTLRYNKGTNDKRFRYYKSGQQSIQLYKKVEPASIRDGLSAGKWGTFCPQKKVLLPQGASFYTLTYKEERDGAPYKVFFDEIGENESLEAGKPYLFIADGTDILGVEAGAAANAANNYNGFHGIVGNSAYTLTVSQAESDAYKYYIIYQNQIRRCGVGDFNMAVGRAYIDMSEVSANAAAPAPGRRRVGMTDPEAPQTFTGVDATMNDGKPMKMFIDGQLFILRNGQIFDTTGRIVK